MVNNENYLTLKPLLRSLLQKSIRRGYFDVAEKTALIISNCGDDKWLDSRIGIIIFEECWPLSSLLPNNNSKIDILKRAACSEKNKSAAGLGALAYAVERGDSSPLLLFPERNAVKIVAAGLRRPRDFFGWLEKFVVNDEQEKIILASKAYLGKATWAWDKAFMIAASYLSIFEKMKPLAEVANEINEDFPYWVAIDRHTPQGRNAMRRLSIDLNVSCEYLSWVGFYFESARINKMNSFDDDWFKKELSWRFSKFGIEIEDIRNFWGLNYHLYKEIVGDHANRLKIFIEDGRSTSSLI